MRDDLNLLEKYMKKFSTDFQQGNRNLALNGIEFGFYILEVCFLEPLSKMVKLKFSFIL